MTEKQLISGLKKGDRKCFDELFLRFYDTAFAYAISLLKDTSTAKDVLQNVFLKLWTARERLDSSKNLKNYIFISIRNEVISHLRLKDNAAKETSVLPEAVDAHADPFSKVVTDEMMARLLAAVESLPPQRRRAFEMSRFEDKTAREIAQEMHLSQRTVEHYIATALSEIKRELS